MENKSIWNQLGAGMSQKQPQQYGYQNHGLLMNNLPQQQNMESNIVDPFSRGRFYGRVYDPNTQISGHEMNVNGWTRRQDI